MHFLCPVCCSLNLQSFQVRDCALHVFFQRVVSSPCCFSRKHLLWNSKCKYWPWFGKWLPKDRGHAFPVLDLSSRNYWAAEGCRLHWVVIVMWVQNPAFSGGAHGKNNTGLQKRPCVPCQELLHKVAETSRFQMGVVGLDGQFAWWWLCNGKSELKARLCFFLLASSCGSNMLASKRC